jgi:hypothetical protein
MKEWNTFHILKNNEKIKEINLEEILINDQECFYLKECLKNHIFK